MWRAPLTIIVTLVLGGLPAAAAGARCPNLAVALDGGALPSR